MRVEQVRSLVNDATKEHLGETAILNEDLTNVVDFGDTVLNVMGYDNYVKAISNVVGRDKFVNRQYSLLVPSILKEKWEYGSILRKISGKIPEAIDNEAWKLQDGQSYPQDVFHQPEATEKLWNSKNTYSIPISITRKQIKESFRSADDLNAFISMLYNNVDISITEKNDALSLELINAFAGAHIANNGTTAIHLLTEYNTLNSTSLTIDDAIYEPEFLRYMIARVKNVASFMRRESTLWNLDGQARFTPVEKLHCVMLDVLKDNIGVFLYDANGQFNTSNLTLEKIESVPFWQGVKGSTEYKISDISKINITTEKGTTEKAGVACVLFDYDALAMCNEEITVDTTPYNAYGKFYTDVYSVECSSFVDVGENGAVFLLD